MTFVDQCLDHIDHTVNFLSCLRMIGCFLDIHICHVFLSFLDKAF